MSTTNKKITHHCDGQCTRGDAVDDFIDLIGVDAKTIEGTGGRELDVCLGRQIAGVASEKKLVQFYLQEEGDTNRRENLPCMHR